MSETSKLESLDPEVCEECSSAKTSGLRVSEGCRSKTLMQSIVHELKVQMRIGLPLVVMNLLWFGKLTTTSIFLGHQGKVNLAGGSLGFSFANVTGFAVLYGISAAMEPICGQAFGAKNFKLLHKTLLMAVLLLLLISIPISILWLNVDKLLIAFGLKQEISYIAKRYIIYLLPDLPILSLLCPLKAYLSSQGVTLPIMYTTAAATSLHIPINIFLSRAKGIQGVAMAVWITDLIVVILLTGYVIVAEGFKDNKWKAGGWLDQKAQDWLKLLKLSGPCCLTVCLEWWCYEILILLAGRLPNPVESVSALIITFNFEYLLYAVMLSLGTCVATRVSNELGANNPKGAYRAACTTLVLGVVSGCIGALVMIACRGVWGSLYGHHDVMIINSVKKLMLIMAVFEVINFPVFVCGEIVRGTAKPSLGMYANLGGFYLLALPLGASLAFKAKLGVEGFLIGFLGGVFVCLLILLIFIARIDWEKEAGKAKILTCSTEEEESPQDSRQ
ncbi:unnamed protein product [Eruca vesicaria subsp. sativa]|uniref:Protein DETOXIFICATION n=1 Tax=Eruca vesicaria subsp. sativa TaxID=29727 RepID=A0ABC8JEZ5_ERUVS|nr:unnamed protein product [Eruca vesicaria subsp. sativa]